jgi:hypothetical protein
MTTLAWWSQRCFDWKHSFTGKRCKPCFFCGYWLICLLPVPSFFRTAARPTKRLAISCGVYDKSKALLDYFYLSCIYPLRMLSFCSWWLFVVTTSWGCGEGVYGFHIIWSVGDVLISLRTNICSVVSGLTPIMFIYAIRNNNKCISVDLVAGTCNGLILPMYTHKKCPKHFSIKVKQC